MSKLETPNTPPKTETNSTSFPKWDNPFASFNPMAAWTNAQATFHKMFEGGFGRAQAFADECAAFEQQMYVRAQANVLHWAQLAQDAIAYSQQLSAQTRKLGLDAARKMGVGA